MLVDWGGMADGDGGWGLLGGRGRLDYPETIRGLSGNLGWQAWAGRPGLAKVVSVGPGLGWVGHPHQPFYRMRT